MLDRKIVINELRKRGYIAEEKNVVKNGVLCDGISIHLPETKMENEKVQSVFGVIYMDTLEEMKYGASAIINKERLSDYCHEIDINKIVVIPSSIHEMLFLPWDEEIDERYMDEMIQELNDTLVSPIEQLGNKSYIMEV